MLREHGFTTPELARNLGITAEGLRVHLCRRGSYFGVTPERMPNGRLLWPADSLERLKEAGRRTPTPVVGRNRKAESVVERGAA
jgi:hypothetical protein